MLFRRKMVLKQNQLTFPDQVNDSLRRMRISKDGCIGYRIIKPWVVFVKVDGLVILERFIKKTLVQKNTHPSFPTGVL